MSILRNLLVLSVFGSAAATCMAQEAPVWKKHVVHTGFHTNTAVAADFTGDGKVDIISNSGGKTRLFVAPDWKEVVIHADPKHDCIHSAVMDVDGDGDPDWIGARYSPGLIFWLERPDKPLSQPWKFHLVDDKVNGIHGLVTGDIDRDGKPDLVANSAQPKGAFPNSIAWFRVPKDPRRAKRWERYIFAKGDAPGLSHYMGVGDVNGDGRPDIAAGAKGGPTAVPGTGDWFAWWEAPKDPRKPWKKHLISAKQPGATNIHPADVNGDGKVDFIASRGHGRGVVWFEAPRWTEHVIHPTIKEPHALVVADIDGDGDLDAATCAFGDRIAAWFENDGKGNFKTHVVGREQAAYDIRAVDLDGDGDLDLLIAGQRSKNVVWYENPLK
jgi:FG-GAP-like repeat